MAMLYETSIQWSLLSSLSQLILAEGGKDGEDGGTVRIPQTHGQEEKKQALEFGK